MSTLRPCRRILARSRSILILASATQIAQRYFGRARPPKFVSPYHIITRLCLAQRGSGRRGTSTVLPVNGQER